MVEEGKLGQGQYKLMGSYKRYSMELFVLKFFRVTIILGLCEIMRINDKKNC